MSSIDNSIETISCSETKIQLYLNTKPEPTPISSYGICVQCNTPFHISVLYTHPGITYCSWPIVYEGLWCKSCWNQ